VDRFDRIVSIDNEVLARILDDVLTEQGIPHIMRSYHDSAYDGVFQLSHGWGFVEAPAEFKAEILSIIEDLKQTPPVP
jgi:hypothetical protein